MGARGLVFFLLLGFIGCRSQPDIRTLDVSAAASLTDALDTLAARYEQEKPGIRVRLNLGASSTLARQIAAGAPADVFISAHPQWGSYLKARGIGEEVDFPLQNRLVVVGLRDRELPTLAEAGRIAVGDPEHVPVGVYAREWLECEGLWPEVAPRIVPSLDTRAALLAVRTGAVDLAIAYASDVAALPEMASHSFPASRCHPDIRYAATVFSSQEGERFVEFLFEEAQRGIWQYAGFSVAR